MLVAYLISLIALPIVNSFLLGAGGCCCTCGIPQPVFCGCQTQITCPLPLPCPLPQCPVCQVCPAPVQCPPPPVAVCPAPQPVYVRPACGGGGCGSFGESQSRPTFGGYAVAGQGFGGGGGGAGPSGGFGPQGFGAAVGGCSEQECRAKYNIPPTGGEALPLAPTFSGSSSYGSSFGAAGASIPYNQALFAGNVAPGATFSELPQSPLAPSLPVSSAQSVAYSQGSTSSSGGSFASGSSQQSLERDLNNVQNTASTDDLSNEERRKYAVESLRRARAVLTAKDSKCNSDMLMKLILKNIVADDPLASKRAIHRAALRDINDAIIDVICSDAGFTYIVSTAEHCEAQRERVICFIYKKP